MRLILTVTTGRSGTAYLAQLYESTALLASLHEPPPQYQSVMLDLQREGPAAAQRFIETVKLPELRKTNAPACLETSHYACKGFLEAYVQAGHVPDLILLSRDPRSIASSWFIMGADFHGKKESILKHLLHPEDRRRLYLHLPGWQAFNNYQLCYWYVLENQYRQAHYQQALAAHGASVYATSLERLQDPWEMIRLGQWLGLEAGNLEGAAARTGMRINDRSHIKTPARQERQERLNRLDLDRLEEEVRQAAIPVPQ